MSYLPEGASFEELVADYFVAFRGSGLQLSALDGELCSGWAQAGVPFDVVARGIRRAAEQAQRDARPDDPGLSSLRACRRAVEAEIKKYLDRAAGSPDPAGALAVDRAKKREQKLRRFGKDHPQWSELLQAASARAQRSPPEAREDAVILHALRLLPFEQRVPLYREAKALQSANHTLSAYARRTGRRFHLTAVVRRSLGLPAFW